MSDHFLESVLVYDPDFAPPAQSSGSPLAWPVTNALIPGKENVL